MAKSNYLTRQEVARRIGVSTVTIAQMAQGALKPAVHPKTRKVDFNHQTVKDYMRRRNAKDPRSELHPLDPDYKAPPTLREQLAASNHNTEDTTESQEPNDDSMSEVDVLAVLGDLGKYMNLTLRQIVERHGTLENLHSLLKSIDLLLKIEERDLKNGESSGELISRTYVKTRILGVIEMVFIRLLNDAPKTLVATMISQQKAKASREVIEASVLKVMSSFISAIKKVQVELEK